MHNGTLISDLQSLVTKFGSTGHLGDGAAERSGDSPNGSKSPLLPIQSSPDLSSASPSAGEGLVVDELTYRSYRHNRVTNPHIEAWRWARLFGDSSVRWMEDRYQAEIRGCDADVMTSLEDSIRCGASEICGECLNCKSHCVCGGVA